MADHFSSLRGGQYPVPRALAVRKAELKSTCHVCHSFLASKEPARPRTDSSGQTPLAGGRRLQPSFQRRPRGSGPSRRVKVPWRSVSAVGSDRAGVSSKSPPPRESPQLATQKPRFLQICSAAVRGLHPPYRDLDRSSRAGLSLPQPTPTQLPEEAEGFRQVPQVARGRGLSSGSGSSSAVSVSGRCALGTGRRWLAPWLRLLSRRRLLLPVARAAGRSGVLVSDAAEV